MTAEQWNIGDVMVTRVFEIMLDRHEPITEFLSNQDR